MVDENTQTPEEKVEQAEVAVEAAEEAAKESEEKAEVVEEIAEAAKEKVEEAKEEVKAEEPKKEEKPAPSGKFADLIKTIEGLTALELAELVKELEERFGVSAAAPVAVASGTPAAGAAAGEEEKANYTVVLTNGGSNKIGAIKAVREVLPDLGLVEAKEYVENPPKTLKENVPTEEAKQIKEKLEAAGATVELK
jgi:large subunit ribosomal protein L7/L12